MSDVMNRVASKRGDWVVVHVAAMAAVVVFLAVVCDFVMGGKIILVRIGGDT